MTSDALHDAQLAVIDELLATLGLRALSPLLPRTHSAAEGQAWFGIVHRIDASAPPRLIVESRAAERLRAAAAWVRDPSLLVPEDGGLVSLITDGTAAGTHALRLAGAPHDDGGGQMVMRGAWHSPDGAADALTVEPEALPDGLPAPLRDAAEALRDTPGLWIVRTRAGVPCGLMRVVETSVPEPAGPLLATLPPAIIPAPLRDLAERLTDADHGLGPVFWWIEPDGSQHVALWTRPRTAAPPSAPASGPGTPSRWWHVSDTSAALLQLTLDYRAAPCRQACRFCPESWNLEPGRDAQRYEVQDIIDELEAHLDAHLQPRIYFCAGDVLRSKALFPILDTVRDHGRSVTLSTPGPELADDALVERLAAYPVDFDLTWLADDDATWAAIIGRDEIPGQVRAGLRNLRARRLPVTVSVVVTSVNEARLLPTLRQLRDAEGFRRVLLRGFFPDAQRTPADYLSLYPSWAALSRALDALAFDVPTMEVSLSNVPPCQLQPATVEKLRIRLDQAENTHGTPAPHPECDACVFAERCVRIPPSYPTDREHLPRSAVRAARVAQVLQPNTPP